MSILVINDTASVIGGAASVAIETADILGTMGKNVIFFAAKGPIDARLRNNRNVTVMLLNQQLFLDDSNRLRGAMRGLFNASTRRTLLHLLRVRKDIEVAHVHSWTKGLSSSVFSALKKSGVPTVITAHDYFLTCPNGGLYDYQRCKICPLKPMSPACIRRNCDRRNYLQKLYRVLRTRIQFHAFKRWHPTIINVSEFSRSILESQNAQFAGTVVGNPIAAGNPRLVDCTHNHKYAYIGRVDQEKGVDLFCNALSRLGLPGKVIGTGDQLGALRERYPQLEFLGWQDQSKIPELLQDVRCCVFPSRWYEAAPLAPIEIMHTCGIPFIIADETAASDYIANGKTGLLFKTGDEQSLVDAIKLSQDDATWTEITTAVQKHPQTIQTKERYGAQLLHVYSQAIRKGQKDRNA